MNTKKLALALFPLLLAFASCMNMNSSSGKEGAIRVVLPGGSSRGSITLSKDNAIYTVSLIQDDEQVKEPQTGSAGGGDIAFDNLEPGTYTVEVTARQPDGAFLSKGSQNVKVTAGETTDCSITLILTGNNGKVFSSNYYVLTNSSGYTDFATSINSTTSISTSSVKLGAEDIDGKQFTVTTASGSTFAFTLFGNENPATIAINKSNLKRITDYLYYDTINDSIWLGAYSTTDENCIFFIKDAKEIADNTNYSNPCALSGISIYPNATYTAFAASGTELYIAYTNDGASYLQRASITGNNIDGFTINAIGSPKSTQDMGVDGQITDILIHYDGYVYVLVSQNGEKYATDAYLTNESTNTLYSRGAILRLYSTSNGFKVSAKTGWTESARTIYTKGNLPDALNSPYSGVQGSVTTLESFRNGLDLYIPNYSQRNSHFYGPRRFVAIKPKELTIADSGANLILPDYDNKKTGGFFKHNRVVNVNLYKFAIDSTSVVDLNSISFVAASINTTIGFSTDGYTGATEADE